MRWVILVLALCFKASAQTIYAPFYMPPTVAAPSGPTIWPTNIAGSPQIIAWWYGDAVSGSQGDPVASWPDLSGNSHTQTASGGFRPALQVSDLGSHNSIKYDGSTSGTLCSDSLTNGQPFEVVMMVKYTFLGNVKNWFASGHAAHNLGFWEDGPLRLKTTDGEYGPAMDEVTNSWLVVDVLFNGASSKVLTNNILAYNVSAGSTASILGMSLGYDGGIGGRFAGVQYHDVICTTNLSASQRGTLYTNYFKLNYPTAGLP